MSSDPTSVMDAIESVAEKLPAECKVVADKLLVDTRMPAVWQALMARKLVDPRHCEVVAFFYDLHGWWVNASKQFDQHEIACAIFFVAATYQFTTPVEGILRDEAKVTVRRYRDAAKCCEELSKLVHSDSRELVNAFEKVKDFLEREADQVSAGIPRLLGRSTKMRGDDETRFRVRRLFETTSKLFAGARPYVAVAVASTVAVGHEVKSKSVETWVAPKKDAAS